MTCVKIHDLAQAVAEVVKHGDVRWGICPHPPGGDGTAVAEHNVSPDAHSDIRQAIENITIEGGIPEAPADGKQYGRQDEQWTEIETGISEEKVQEITNNAVNAIKQRLADLISTDDNNFLKLGSDGKLFVQKGEKPKEDDTIYGLTSTGIQYIDTGIIPGSGNFSVEIDARWERSTGSAQYCGIFMASGRSNRFFFGAGSTNSFRSAVGDLTAQNTDANVFTARRIYELEYTRTAGVCDIKIDGVIVNTRTGTGNVNFTEPFYLFNTSATIIYPCHMTIWSAKIRANGILVRDFVPVKKGSTRYSDTPAPSNCMWDNVSRQYFENVGAGNFNIIEENEEDDQFDFATDSWAKISENPSQYGIGDTKLVTLKDGQEITLEIWDKYKDNITGGGLAPLTIGLGTDLLNDRYRMNTVAINRYSSSTMRNATIPNVIIPLLPDDLQELLVPVNKVSLIGNTITETDTTSEKAWIPSEREITGTTANGYEREGKQYSVFNGDIFVKNRNGIPEVWFTRSASVNNTTNVRQVASAGTITNAVNVTEQRGVCVGFCIGKDDGEPDVLPLPSNAITVVPFNPVYTRPINQIVFNANNGKALNVYYVLPAQVDVNTKVLFVMHGTARDAAISIGVYRYVAEVTNTIVIAPEFSLKDFPVSAYQQINVVNLAGEVNPPSEWTFNILDEIFAHFKTQFEVQTAKYIISGHSAGGQFASRTAIFNQSPYLDYTIVVNAGSYTFFDETRDYHHGIQNLMFHKQIFLNNLSNHKLYVLGGDRDTDIRDPNLPNVPWQGAHRFARAVNFYLNARQYASANSVNFNWEIRLMAGVGHNHAQAMPFVLDILREV